MPINREQLLELIKDRFDEEKLKKIEEINFQYARNHQQAQIYISPSNTLIISLDYFYGIFPATEFPNLKVVILHCENIIQEEELRLGLQSSQALWQDKLSKFVENCPVLYFLVLTTLNDNRTWHFIPNRLENIQEFKKLKEEVAKLTEKLSESNEINILQNKVNLLENKINETRNNESVFASQIENLSNQLERINQINQALEAAKTKIEELEQNLNQQSSQQSISPEQIESLKSRIQQEKVKREELERRIGNLTNQGSGEESITLDKIQELENKISVLNELIANNRADLNNNLTFESSNLQNKILELTEKLAREEEKSRSLQERVNELREEVHDLKDRTINYEHLQSEIREREQQINLLDVKLHEKGANEQELQAQIVNLSKQLEIAKQKVQEKDEEINKQIENIIEDEEKNQEFINNLKNEKSKNYLRNRHFFLKWLKEFTEANAEFSLECFNLLYPNSDIFVAEEFVEEIKKDLLISYICEQNKIKLIPYLLSNERVNKKYRHLVEQTEPNATKFFMSNIGISNDQLFYDTDPIFTSELWKKLKQDNKQKEINQIKEKILLILDEWQKIGIEEKQRQWIQLVIKNIKDSPKEFRKDINKEQLKVLNELLVEYPPNNSQLIPLKKQWEDLNKRKSLKRQVTEYCIEHKGKTFEAEKQPTWCLKCKVDYVDYNEEAANKPKENWDIIANYIQELDKKGFLTYYFRYKKWNEKRMREVINAFLQSIYGTLKEDKGYHQLPPLDLNKPFEELIPWTKKGVCFGHKTLTASNDSGLSFNSPPPSPIIKPFNKPFEEPKPEAEPDKKSIYNWLKDGEISNADFNKCLELVQKNIIDNNFYTLKELQQILKQEIPSTKSKEPKAKKNWTNISPDFTPELTQEWINAGFNQQQAREWINAGFKVQDGFFCSWIKWELGLAPEQILNENINIEELREQYEQSSLQL